MVATFQMAGDLGAVLGPVVAGWIADASGYDATFAVAAAVCVAPLAAVAAAPGDARPHRTGGAPSPPDAARDPGRSGRHRELKRETRGKDHSARVASTAILTLYFLASRWKY